MWGDNWASPHGDYVSRSVPSSAGHRFSKSPSRWSPRFNRAWIRCCVSGHVRGLLLGSSFQHGIRYRRMITRFLLMQSVCSQNRWMLLLSHFHLAMHHLCLIQMRLRSWSWMQQKALNKWLLKRSSILGEPFRMIEGRLLKSLQPFLVLLSVICLCITLTSIDMLLLWFWNYS